jgi:hypothetical protein
VTEAGRLTVAGILPFRAAGSHGPRRRLELTVAGLSTSFVRQLDRTV